MAKFTFGEYLTQANYVFSTKLGTASPKLTDADVGFPVKLGADSTFIKCVDGDQIEGFISSVETAPIDDRAFGGVKTGKFLSVTVYGPIAIGDYLVAETVGRVKKAPAVTVGDATTVPKYVWRYVSGGVTAGATVVSTGVALRI